MTAPVAAGAPLRGDLLADAGDLALSREELASAVELFDQAEPDVSDPDRCAGGRWMAHMLRGDFEAAWRESDAIRRRGRPDPHRFWNGEALEGKRVMLRSLHGFGDAVQMFRFLPRLLAIASELLVEVPPRFQDIARHFMGMGTVLTWGEGAPTQAPEWDVQMEVMELPYALRASAQDLQPTEGYLTLPQEVVLHAQHRLGSKTEFRVGLVWSAGVWNPSRSIPFGTMRKLLLVEGVAFWSLQGEPGRTEWLARGEVSQCRDGQVCGDGILNLAGAISQMDLVISVDTLAAHLAGALGVPCWLLLQHRADWRWMSGRNSTPWYPSLRLFRQSRPGSWDGLLDVVTAELEREKARHKEGR